MHAYDLVTAAQSSRGQHGNSAPPSGSGAAHAAQLLNCRTTHLLPLTSGVSEAKSTLEPAHSSSSATYATGGWSPPGGQSRASTST